MTERVVSSSDSLAASVASCLIKLFPLVSLDQSQGLTPTVQLRAGNSAEAETLGSALCLLLWTVIKEKPLCGIGLSISLQ